jgi:hypothetical protein
MVGSGDPQKDRCGCHRKVPSDDQGIRKTDIPEKLRSKTAQEFGGYQRTVWSKPTAICSCKTKSHMINFAQYSGASVAKQPNSMARWCSICRISYERSSGCTGVSRSTPVVNGWQTLSRWVNKGGVCFQTILYLSWPLRGTTMSRAGSNLLTCSLTRSTLCGQILHRSGQPVMHGHQDMQPTDCRQTTPPRLQVNSSQGAPRMT